MAAKSAPPPECWGTTAILAAGVFWALVCMYVYICIHTHIYICTACKFIICKERVDTVCVYTDAYRHFSEAGLDDCQHIQPLPCIAAPSVACSSTGRPSRGASPSHPAPQAHPSKLAAGAQIQCGFLVPRKDLRPFAAYAQERLFAVLGVSCR